MPRTGEAATPQIISTGRPYGYLYKALALVALCAVVFTGASGIDGSYAADGDVEISEANFPDPHFRDYLLDPANLGGIGADGVLTGEELAGVQSIKIANKLMTSAKGIEYFTELTSLNFEGNHLTEIDLSQNPKLKLVYLRNNQLASIDFSRNTELDFIEIFDNQLSSIDVSMLPNLRFLHVDHNDLTTLDLSQNHALEASGFVARNNPHLTSIHLPVIPGGQVRLEDFVEQDPVPGYGVAQWYDEADPDTIIGTGDQTAPEGTIPMNGQTLRSFREPNTYTVNYVAGAADAEGELPATHAVWNKDFEVPKNPFTRDGYVFVGWQLPTTRVVQPGETLRNVAGKDRTDDSVNLIALWEADPAPPEPTVDPTTEPTTDPTGEPSPEPTVDPSTDPTVEPTEEPTVEPSTDPTTTPTVEPTPEPTVEPSDEPTVDPAPEPTVEPTSEPTEGPTTTPAPELSDEPTEAPAAEPTAAPEPTVTSSVPPTAAPGPDPRPSATAVAPTVGPSTTPTSSHSVHLAHTGTPALPLLLASATTVIFGGVMLWMRRAAALSSRRR